ncbi:MAG: SDR family oxidoreductase [Stappiaceae bacterium]
MAQSPNYPCLSGKCAVLTGGAGGIGRAILSKLHRHGTKVFVLDRDKSIHSIIQEQFPSGELTPRFLACDLLDINALKTTIQTIGDQESRIDFVINCAGDDTRHEWMDVDAAAWDECQNLNLRHVFFAAQSAQPFMGEGSAVVNLGSKTAVNKKAGLIGYATAKAGIMGLTGSLAREFGQWGIRVNCVMPGLVETKRNYDRWITPDVEDQVLQRQCIKSICQPEDVSDLVAFLCSSQSRMITGQTIAIDGGS